MDRNIFCNKAGAAGQCVLSPGRLPLIWIKHLGSGLHWNGSQILPPLCLHYKAIAVRFRATHRDFRVTSMVQFSSVTQLCLTLWHHGLQYSRLPCLSSMHGAYSNSCPLSWWCHPNISSSGHPLLLPPSIFPNIRFFSNGSVLPIRCPKYWNISFSIMNIQDWFPLGWRGWISLQLKGLSRVFSNTIVQKHQFFGAQLTL